MASGAAALPALWVLFLAVVERLRERARVRREALDRPPTAAERLRHLPDDRPGRLAALDAVVRQALADHGGIEVRQLDRDASIAALPVELASRLRAAVQVLDRARFAGGPDDGIEETVRELVRELASP